MDRDEGWQILDEHRERVAGLLDGLTPADWTTPSLCAGWTVRDVAAHLSIAATMPMAEVLVSAVRAGGSFDRMIRDTALRRARARTPDRIVADLRGVVGSRRLAPTTTWQDPLLDILVHAQDIARPLGRTFPLPPEATRLSAEWVWQRGFPFRPAQLLAGVRLVADDVEWSRGEGVELTGPITSLLLLSTGRMSALDDVRGPGRDLLAAA